MQLRYVCSKNLTGVLVFGVALTVAVLISGAASRTMLSTAVWFLAVGFLTGPHIFGLLGGISPQGLTRHVTTIALFAVLFTDGMEASLHDLRTRWRLPARALLVGLPLTIALNVLVCRFVGGLPWVEAWLIGAALGPTDPVLASAIVGNQRVPGRLRNLLNVESGLNDGLAFPLIAALISFSHPEPSHPARLAANLGLGVVLGVLVAWLIVRIQRTRFLAASALYRPLLPVAIALLIFGAAGTTGGNEFLAAFSAGVTLATIASELRESFQHFGELVTELLKLGSVLLFGASLGPRLFVEADVWVYLAAGLILVAVRPIALTAALVGAKLSFREFVVAAWFGPKGFASVVYGLLIMHSVPHVERGIEIVAITVAASILAHSSTDVPIARWLARAEGEP